ncbi:hypothetical protein POM88_034344 [Heracleum sosnowskyi]|uniref:Homeobox domain-containing protein n=1 Tax=Heracleum sosnowskyi TaxID=360622 RepID=A0AAD8MCX2_9APIA|nr:hypothetical protein POM88_034344 [Heracleum sosnowskyi]
MSGEFPMIPTTGSSSAAKGAIYVSDPFAHLQNVNPSTSMAFGHVYPSNPEMGGGSGGYEQNAGLSSNDVQQTGPIERRRSSRHSPQQIQGLEAAFKECPYPNHEQRQKLSGDLGLTTPQVKHWFQNKRNQEKVIQERIENAALKAMLDELKRGNVTQLIKELKSEIINLKAEHAESKKEYDGLNATIAILAGNSQTMGSGASPIPSPSLD